MRTETRRMKRGRQTSLLWKPAGLFSAMEPTPQNVQRKLASGTVPEGSVRDNAGADQSERQHHDDQQCGDEPVG